MPTDGYWGIFGELLLAAGITGPTVTDVALAALAIDHGAVLYSADRDFRRFESHGLKWIDPLAATRHRVQDAFRTSLEDRGQYR